MNMINAAINGLLTKSQAKVYQGALQEAVGDDGILTKAEFKNANEAFSKTETFTGLSDADQKSFKKKLDADTLWEKQGASSVTTYDGMEKQIAYYKEVLGNGNKDKNGNPVVVTQEQLNYAKDKGFGDTNGDNKITGLELAVADINGDEEIDSKDGDITGNGKVNPSDRGINFRSDETASATPASDGLNMENFMAFFQQLMQILGMNMPTMPTTKTT
jgi:hypothetical protein